MLKKLLVQPGESSAGPSAALVTLVSLLSFMSEDVQTIWDFFANRASISPYLGKTANFPLEAVALTFR